MTVEYYKGTADGGNILYTDATYSTAHDAANGETVQDNGIATSRNSLIGGDYHVRRSFVTIDTSALPDAANITAAKLFLGVAPLSVGEADSGQATLHIVEGVQNVPIIASDFGDHLGKTISGGSIDISGLEATSGAIVIELNVTGLGLINKTGITKFCLRTAGDIDNSTPSGDNKFVTSYLSQSRPFVVISAATAITSKDAQLNATIYALGFPGLEVTYDGDDKIYPRAQFTYRAGSFPAGGSPDTQWEELLGLEATIQHKAIGLDLETLYWFKVRAENELGTHDPTGPSGHLNFTTLADTDLLRVTALVIHWSAGPNAVYQQENLTGGLFSQYFSPISPIREPEATLPELIQTRQPARDLLSKMVPTLREYGQWLKAHSQEEQRAILRGIPGADVLTLRVWQEWVVRLRSMGQDV